MDITDQPNVLVDFLQQKAAAGKLVIVTGTTTSTGSVASYTPASGNTFVLVKATIRINGSNTNQSVTAQLRNNSTVVDTIYGVTGTITLYEVTAPEFIITGDQLVGNGSKKYDINISANDGSLLIAGTILGYLV